MKTLTQKLAVLGIAALGAASAASAQDMSIVYVTPNPIGNNAFLSLGQDGTNAAAEALGAKVATFESDAPPAILENLYAAVNEGADLVVSISFSAVDSVMEVAPTAPDVDFLLVDACPFGHGLPNVHCAVFREHEASFLIGATAALVTKSDTIGSVGPIDIPFMHRFTGGFKEGALFVNPDLKVENRWVGGQNPFSDPVRAKEQARALNAIGADVIYAAAAGGSFGIFEAAAEDGFKVFGVDSNLCGVAAGAMYDVALKHVDQAILQSVEAIVGGTDSFFASYGLAEGGMGALSLLEGDALANSGCLIADEAEVVAKIREISAQIVAGDIAVTDPLAQ